MLPKYSIVTVEAEYSIKKMLNKIQAVKSCNLKMFFTLIKQFLIISIIFEYPPSDEERLV